MLEEIYTLREQAKKEGNPVLRDKSFELLLETIKEKQPKRILEIGTNVGLSSVAMLLTSQESKLVGIEIDEEKIESARKNYKHFGVEDRAQIFFGNASEVIPMLSGEFDFIFLDGPKGHYYEYLTNLLSLLKKGGILFADNVLHRGFLSGKVFVPKRHNTIKHSLENFIERITTDKNLKTQIFDLEDGVSITEKL